jgi:hypothetical protein
MANNTPPVLLGSYLTSKVTLGTILTCEARDVDLVVSGYSSGRIPWPVGHLRTGGRNSLIVFGDLSDAIRRESVQAICHWFGPAPNVVWRWRFALGVGMENLAARKAWWQHVWAFPCTSGKCFDSDSYPLLFSNQSAQNPPLASGLTPATANEYGLASQHPGVVMAGMMDGSCRSVSTRVSQATFNLAMCPGDGGLLPGDW